MYVLPTTGRRNIRDCCRFFFAYTLYITCVSCKYIFTSLTYTYVPKNKLNIFRFRK